MTKTQKIFEPTKKKKKKLRIGIESRWPREIKDTRLQLRKNPTRLRCSERNYVPTKPLKAAPSRQQKKDKVFWRATRTINKKRKLNQNHSLSTTKNGNVKIVD